MMKRFRINILTIANNDFSYLREKKTLPNGKRVAHWRIIVIYWFHSFSFYIQFQSSFIFFSPLLVYELHLQYAKNFGILLTVSLNITSVAMTKKREYFISQCYAMYN